MKQQNKDKPVQRLARSLFSWESTRHWKAWHFALLWLALLGVCGGGLWAQQRLQDTRRRGRDLAVLALCAATSGLASGLYGRRQALADGR